MGTRTVVRRSRRVTKHHNFQQSVRHHRGTAHDALYLVRIIVFLFIMAMIFLH